MKRVVVTGMAGITSLGSDWETIAGNFAANRSGIRRMDEWDRFSELNTRLAGPIDDFMVPGHWTRKQLRSMGRVSRLAVGAAEQALADAGLLGLDISENHGGTELGFFSLTTLQSTRGVARLIRLGGKPACVADALIAQLRERCSLSLDQPQIYAHTPSRGDPVLITAGPFAGFDALFGYAQLLVVLIGCMLFIAFVVNPLIVFWKIKRNPYPLVLTCLKESGVTAFFTRSSAANIPVNMALAEKLRLPEDTYAVSIPLGATINMAGAAITITVLSMAAVHTLGMEVDLATAILLSVVATVSACGASGVAGGSLLLIPLACSLFGISNDIAMQVVAVGFIIGVLQDSAETALNSSTDVLFTAAACMAEDESLLDAAPVPSREA